VPGGIPCRAGSRAVRDPVPCGIPCRVGYRAARDIMPCGILRRLRGISCRVAYRAAWDPVPCGIPRRVGYRAAWDPVPRGIPCRVGYRAARDTVPRGIPCRAGYHAAQCHSRDTVLRGIPCRVGSHACCAGADLTITAAIEAIHDEAEDQCQARDRTRMCKYDYKRCCKTTATHACAGAIIKDVERQMQHAHAAADSIEWDPAQRNTPQGMLSRTAWYPAR
jgi:hypothetical protein